MIEETKKIGTGPFNNQLLYQNTYLFILFINKKVVARG